MPATIPFSSEYHDNDPELRWHTIHLMWGGQISLWLHKWPTEGLIEKLAFVPYCDSHVAGGWLDNDKNT